jgi:hypothetical protein
MEGEEVNELELNTDELVNVALGTNFAPFVILMRRQHLDNKTFFWCVSQTCHKRENSSIEQDN